MAAPQGLMATRQSSDRRPVAVALFVLAGMTALVSAAMGWGDFLALGLQPPSRIGHAYLGISLAVLMVVAAALVIQRSWRLNRRVLAVPLLGALTLAGFAAFDLATERSRALASFTSDVARGVVDIPLPPGVPVARLNANGLVVVSIRPGIYLAFAAAILAVAGTVLALRPATADGAADPLIRPVGTDDVVVDR